MSATMTEHRFTKGTPAASMADPGQRPATPRQIDFLVDLVKQIGAYDAECGHELWMDMRARQAAGLVFAEAAAQIDDFKAFRNELRQTQLSDPAEDRGTPRPARPQVPAGRYAIDNAEGKTAFYRVAEKDGLLTVFVYASDAQHKLPWKTALPVLRKIEKYGLHEASVRFGVESETCYKCGKRLTREHTRAVGIGDDCAAKA
jgi:hypothetical protein